MTEEQCLRPSDRESRSKRKRIIGWLAGHEIHLEIEDVLDKKRCKSIGRSAIASMLLIMGAIYISLGH